ncbi:MAG: Lin0512 family protein [Chloroflexi bacterium]|nr:Lin0512 family protein [Chloroflexota bacterium]MCI0788614.1 Lin0512 family protein [Chloroflexota bacterium]
MAMVRCITEMGMGVDVHGLDYTKAATRAVFDALHHCSLGFQRMLGKTADDMTVSVTIGVSKPEKVDTKAVAASLPHGTVTCEAVAGGLEIPSVDGNDGMLIANAVIIVSFDDGK